MYISIQKKKSKVLLKPKEDVEEGITKVVVFFNTLIERQSILFLLYFVKMCTNLL